MYGVPVPFIFTCHPCAAYEDSVAFRNLVGIKWPPLQDVISLEVFASATKRYESGKTVRGSVARAAHAK